jgi:MFS family permease
LQCIWSLGGLAGSIAFGFIADRIGRRGTVIVYTWARSPPA